MASNTINDLYLKYVNKVGRALESDRYFQYLFEMVQAGNNELQQMYQVMHKVVDEKWLSTIEECLDDINTIIEKPRRFITTNEEVVPVALAKKISADSVRHLSMNTQFIASSEDGDIQPTRVLNVSSEESYDLYENRFIYHLIQRLVTFIDKRTDVIFWSTGDETQNKLVYHSKVDDAYEEIDYKIEMTVKNRQSFAENDNDNMNVFMRIDRVRRMVLALKNSSFCSIMAGCAKVRSPIQRTNLIMKDPHYRACYKLWQFLENYDDVGYSIEVQNSTLEFDEEYMIQMYTNLITNYTVFKSLLEGDSRRVEQVLAKKRRVIKPKFIKKIQEEFVDSRDIEDVEIRKVFVEEVTQAQIEAEEKLALETQARIEAEQTLEDMDSQMISLQQQVSNLMMMNQEAEIRAQEERTAKEEALREIDTQKEALEKEMAAQRESFEQEISSQRENYEREISSQKESFEQEITTQRETLEQEIATQRETLEQQMATQRESYVQEIERNKNTWEQEWGAQKDRYEREMLSQKESYEKLLANQTESYAQQKEEICARLEEMTSRAVEHQEAAERSLEEARIAREEAMVAREEIARLTEELRRSKEEAAREIAGAKREVQAAKQEVTHAKQEILKAKEEAQKQIEDARIAVEAIREEAQLEVQKVEEEQDKKAKELMKKQEIDAKAQLEKLEQEKDAHYGEILERLEERSREELQSLQQKAQEQKDTLESRINTLQQNLEQLENHNRSINKRNQDMEQELTELHSHREALEEQLMVAEKEKEAALESARIAEEKEKANTLSHYIISVLNERKKKNESNEDEEK